MLLHRLNGGMHPGGGLVAPVPLQIDRPTLRARKPFGGSSVI